MLLYYAGDSNALPTRYEREENKAKWTKAG